MGFKVLKVCDRDAQFLCRLMNDQSILDALNEVSTKLCDWIDAISAWNDDPDEEDYILFDEQTPVGWLGVNGLLSEDKTAYIKMVALLPQYQNNGLGTRAVHWCLDNLKSREYETVILYTNRNNVRAQNCYAKCGFKVTEELTEEMSNGDIVKRYKMECTLS